MSGLVFVHGLPGSGKTSLCRELQERRDDLLYVDTAKSPRWGEVPAWQICADEYREHGDGRWLLTEGFAARRAPRERFVTALNAAMAEQLGEPVRRVEIVFLQDPGSEVLSQRRNRTAAEYEALRERLQLGSRSFGYRTFSCEEGETVGDLASRFEDLLDRWMRSDGSS